MLCVCVLEGGGGSGGSIFRELNAQANRRFEYQPTPNHIAYILLNPSTPNHIANILLNPPTPNHISTESTHAQPYNQYCLESAQSHHQHLSWTSLRPQEARIKELYRELELEKVFKEYEDSVYIELMALIAQEAKGIPEKVFMDFAKKIFRRQK